LPDLVTKGFVCQCPMAAVWTEQLAEWGKVYWVTRNHEQIVTSMLSTAMPKMFWPIMKTFREQWPDDPLWGVLEYDGKEDVYYDYPGYATLIVKVKEYFFDKYLSDIAEKIVTEEQPYYDRQTMGSLKNPLHPQAKAMFDWYSQYWEHINESLRLR